MPKLAQRPLSEVVLPLLRSKEYSAEDAGFELLEVMAIYERELQSKPRVSARWDRPKDRLPGETAEQFLRRHWGPLIAAKRVSRSDLLRADKALYQAWFNWLRSNPEPKDLMLSKKAELFVEKAQARGERAKRAYKRAMSLSNKYRRMIRGTRAAVG